MIDIKVIREAYSCNKIKNNDRIKTKSTIADKLAELGKYNCLDRLLDTGKITIDSEQLITRDRNFSYDFEGNRQMKSRTLTSNTRHYQLYTHKYCRSIACYTTVTHYDTQTDSTDHDKEDSTESTLTKHGACNQTLTERSLMT